MLVLFIIMALVVVMKRNFDASMKWLLIAGVVAIITVLLGVAFLGVFGMMSKENSLSKPMTLDADYANIQEMPASKAMEKSMEVLGSGEGAINVPVREGILPVRFELPALGKSITMKSHLINKDEPLRVGVLIASTWLKFLAYAISLVAGVLCTRMPRH
jgi:hypothetical protein